ncbi:uncharacterized protein LOC119687657 [Teleopsis dalmanni]|uniref:uncharacterized protein LOC119687657 n=1 Tax=Teleopsis dalmanni TaxID=139649 RepID=UPI0018CCBA65|nr:uncharacterized protein LOC119687657 [Teleopsis dalmanni]
MKLNGANISKYKDGILEKCWIISVYSKNWHSVYAKAEIDIINVPKICAYINELIIQSSEQNQLAYSEEGFAPSKRNIEEFSKVAKVAKPQLPFCMAYKLYWGTLRIYRVQVKNLLKSTNDLLTETGLIINIGKKQASKRSKKKTIKKAKKVLMEKKTETDSSLNSSTYVDLLEEAEKLAHLGDEAMDYLIKTHNKHTVKHINKIQLREEPLKDALSLVEAELDDDGFGDMTLEDMKEFEEIIMVNTRKRKVFS